MTVLTDVFPDLAHAGERPIDLLVVGDTGVDLLVQVDELPKRDSKSIGTSLGIFAGGMGASFASSARRAAEDLDIALVSRVGSDAFGRACLLDLEDQRIGTALVETMADEMTWWCAVAIADDGEKSLLGGRSPASLPGPEQVDAAALVGARWLHVLGDVPGSEDIVRRAADAGTLASVDIEGSFVRTDRGRAEELLRTARLSVLNEESLHALAELDDVHEALVELLGRSERSSAILLTLGTAGSLFAWRSDEGALQTIRQAAEPVTRVVDTTGAGDSFAGAWVGRALAGDDLTEALAAAARSAALTITHFGARQGGLPNWTTTNTKDAL
ncbi:carbohydrate kinase family protein [Plantibacter sp. YIM 135249]|uniref:carbohydrate kinase family protein n=1 Tax=Plantibacter sp. YIM 135249 TaxID=3423918 RepID=UPI003D350AD6